MSSRSSRFFRRSLRRKPFFWLAVALLSFVVSAVATIQGCSRAFNNPTGAGGNSYSTSAGEGGSDAAIDVTPDGMNPPMKLDYSALCGAGCKPGSTASCGMTSSSAATSGSSSSSSSGGGSTSAGTGGAASSTASSSGSGSSSGSSTSSGLAPTELGCQITADGADPMGVCAPTGHSASGGPCQSAADCNDGLGCVAVSGAGVCRPYCCGSLEACGKGTFCTPLPMKERFDRPIPVCTPVTPCELFTTSCPNGDTCTIVRADGTTSCAPKGTGKSCDPCPCGSGYMCSATGVCQKLCHTTPTNECGAGSTCQGGSANFPSGVGICVGGANDCLH